jgi:putative (di)nucleoside polyphosphate hydrolase
MTVVLDLPYRRGVGVIVLNREERIFVGRRIHSRTEAWQMPQGGIDPEEDALTAAKRELEEETGIRSITLLAKAPEILRYDLPEDLRAQVLGGCFRGQAQQWYVFRFDGQDNEVNLHAHHAPEFIAWHWVDPSFIMGRVVSFKRPLYHHLLLEWLPSVLESEGARG